MKLALNDHNTTTKPEQQGVVALLSRDTATRSARRGMTSVDDVSRTSSNSNSEGEASQEEQLTLLLDVERKLPVKKRRFRASMTNYYKYSPPPTKLRRLVASCWLGPTCNESTTTTLSTGEPNWKEITKLPPSSGSYWYDERYDDNDQVETSSTAGASTTGVYIAPTMQIIKETTTTTEDSSANRGIERIPSPVASHASLFRPASSNNNLKDLNEGTHEKRCSSLSYSSSGLEDSRRGAFSPGPKAFKDIVVVNRKKVDDSAAINNMEIEEEHELLNMETIPLTTAKSDEASLRESELVTPSPNVLQQLQKHRTALLASEKTTGVSQPIAQNPIYRPTPLRRNSAKVVASSHPPSPMIIQHDSSVACSYSPLTSEDSGTEVQQAMQGIESGALVAKSKGVLHVPHGMMQQQLTPRMPVTTPVSTPVRPKRSDFFANPVQDGIGDFSKNNEDFFFPEIGQGRATSILSTTKPSGTNHHHQVEYPLNFQDYNEKPTAPAVPSNPFRSVDTANASFSLRTPMWHHPQPHLMVESPFRRNHRPVFQLPEGTRRFVPSAFAPGLSSQPIEQSGCGVIDSWKHSGIQRASSK